jgi:hypothetical protein
MTAITRLSKVISGLLVVLFAVNWYLPDTADYVSLVPGRTLPCVWNLVTAGLLVVNPWEASARCGADSLRCGVSERAPGWRS